MDNVVICLESTSTPMFVHIVVNILSSEQEVKVQELSEDVPVGHIPRSLTVQVKGDLTRSLG